MKEIIVKNQKDFDKIPKSYDGNVVIRDTTEYVDIDGHLQEACVSVSDNATIESVSDNATIESVYGNATIESVSDNATIESVYGNATIEYVSDNATIESVYGNATIESVYGNATIKYVSDNATIEYVYGNATIKSVYGNATIESVYGNATIESVYGNATIKYVSGNATILLITAMATICLVRSAKKIVARGSVVMRVTLSARKSIHVFSRQVSVIIVKENTRCTWLWFKNNYPVEAKGKKVLLYKAVHKKGKHYFSEYNNNFSYEVGNTYTHANAPRSEGSCASGLHVAHEMWARLFGSGWTDLAILECAVDPKDIVVCDDCDGKVRTSKLKVLREVV